MGWLLESIGLTPFVVGLVLIRVEKVTDKNVHGDGLLINRACIREFAQTAVVGAECEPWTTAGFSLIGGRHQYTLIVQVVETAPDGSSTVSRIPLGHRKCGDLSYSPVTAGPVIAVVSSTTPGTLHPAGYVLRLEWRSGCRIVCGAFHRLI